MNRKPTLAEAKVLIAETIIGDYNLGYYGASFHSTTSDGRKNLSRDEVMKIIFSYCLDDTRTMTDTFGKGVFNQIVYTLKYSD